MDIVDLAKQNRLMSIYSLTTRPYMFVSQHFRMSSDNTSRLPCPCIHYFNTMARPFGKSHESNVIGKSFDKLSLSMLHNHIRLILATFDALEHELV